MRIIMMGTGPFAVPTLEKIAASDKHTLVVVVTKPPRGKRREPPNPMRLKAEELGLPVWMPESSNLAESQQQLHDYKADLLVVCDYGEILRPATLATTRLGGINLHGSLLPKYRGAAPVQWAILNGDAETGNSVIQMTPGLDAGPCLAQESTPIGPDEIAETLEARLSVLGAELTSKVLDQLANGTEKPSLQDQAARTKAPRLSKRDGVIEWGRTAQEIKNQVRGLQPWPGAFTFWKRSDKEPLRISLEQVSVVQLAEVVGEEKLAELALWLVEKPAGTVVLAEEKMVVLTGEGLLSVEKVQVAGKRAMKIADFLRGNKVLPGDFLVDCSPGG